MTSDGQETHYGWRGAPAAGQEHGPGFLARSQLIERSLASLHPGSVLEIGCGRGHVTTRIARHSGRVIAMDVSAAAAVTTRRNSRRLANVDVIVADIERPPFRALFDVVVLAEILEHLEDDRGALQLAADLLQADGRVIVTVPAQPDLWTSQDDMAGHKRRYTRPMLKALIADTGLETLDLISWGFPVTRFLVLHGGSATARYWKEGKRTLPLFMRLARRLYSPLARPVARLECLLSGLDRGVGYALVARRRGETRRKL